MKINDIFPTRCMSIPRSGHNALVDVLRAYFGPAFVYGDIYRNPTSEAEFGKTVNYQKNHDWVLGQPIDNESRHLVQIRNPFDSTASLFTLNRRLEGDAFRHANSYPTWCREHWQYVSRFVNKWLYNPVPHRLVVHYEDLVERPREIVTSVIQFITGWTEIDADKLRVALDAFPLKRRAGANQYPYEKA